MPMHSRNLMESQHGDIVRLSSLLTNLKIGPTSLGDRTSGNINIENIKGDISVNNVPINVNSLTVEFSQIGKSKRTTFTIEYSSKDAPVQYYLRKENNKFLNNLIKFISNQRLGISYNSLLALKNAHKYNDLDHDEFKNYLIILDLPGESELFNEFLYAVEYKTSMDDVS